MYYLPSVSILCYHHHNEFVLRGKVRFIPCIRMSDGPYSCVCNAESDTEIVDATDEPYLCLLTKAKVHNYSLHIS